MNESREFPDTTYDDRPYKDRSYSPADDVRAPAWEEAVEAAAVPVPVTADAPLAPAAVTGNLRRYARWQWRDFWQRRGFWLAGAALFGVWMLVHWMLADRVGVLDAVSVAVVAALVGLGAARAVAPTTTDRDG